MQPLTILSVTRLGSGLYSFQLERPPDESRPFAAPFVPYAQVRVADDVVRFIRDQIGESIERVHREKAGAGTLLLSSIPAKPCLTRCCPARHPAYVICGTLCAVFRRRC